MPPVPLIKLPTPTGCRVKKEDKKGETEYLAFFVGCIAVNSPKHFTMPNEQISAKLKFRYILFLIILFVLPVLSLYFLNSGKNYRLQALSELGQHGKVESFSLKNQRGLEITPQMLHGKVTVACLLPTNQDSAAFYTKRLSIIHESYNDTEDVLFLSFLPSKDSLNLLDKATRLGIKDHDQWWLLRSEDAEQAKRYYHFPEEGHFQIALADTSLTVRNFYNAYENHQMGRLVEHIALIIPQQRRR